MPDRANYRPCPHPGHHRVPPHLVVGPSDPGAAADRLGGPGPHHRRHGAYGLVPRGHRLFLARRAGADRRGPQSPARTPEPRGQAGPAHHRSPPSRRSLFGLSSRIRAHGAASGRPRSWPGMPSSSGYHSCSSPTSFGAMRKRMEDMTLGRRSIIGVAQALAIIPGHEPLGHHHVGGARPGLRAAGGGAVLLPAGLAGHRGVGRAGLGEAIEPGEPISVDALMTGALTFLTRARRHRFLMAVLRRFSLLPFVIYRLLLGAILSGAHLFRLSARRRPRLIAQRGR